MQTVELLTQESRVVFSTYGAALTHWFVRDIDGKERDIIIGWEQTPPDPEKNPYFGCIVGRVANRIGKAQFSLDGVSYNVTMNRPPNHLHGGNIGFSFREWSILGQPTENTVKFQLISADGDEGYPGELIVTICYTLVGSELSIDYHAELGDESASPKTICNLTNHSYFNLSGFEETSVLAHEFEVFADEVVETDSDLIPTGRTRSILDTLLDFSKPALLSENIAPLLDTPYKGFDHFYLLKSGKGLREACRLRCRSSGLELSVKTTYPGFQLYTGNWLSNIPAKKMHQEFAHGAKMYQANAGLCLECQFVPDAINHHQWADSVTLLKGQTYSQKTVYSVKTIN